MKLPKLPSAENRPLWGGLCWAVPFLYVFLDPYQRHADWLEWTLTTIGFMLFLALYTLGLIYWSRKDLLRWICIATTLLAIVFTAYRPTFGLYFALVAAFAPFAVNGNIPLSATFIVTSVLIHLVEAQWLRGAQSARFAVILGIESILIGAGTTFAARQQNAIARAHKNAERERIARDLHDILGHTLSSIILKSELVGKIIEHDPQRARAEIVDIEKISRAALAEVREAIHGYHAGDLQTEFERVDAMLKASGIVVEKHYDTLDIPAAQERILIFALREAATNIVRHAQAKHCRLQLRQADGAYRLNVRDDGMGGMSEQGFGLRGMRYRVEAIGGSLSWNSAIGTELTITLPLTLAPS